MRKLAFDDYLTIVWTVTDLDAIRDITIQERRSDLLYKPLMHTLSILVSPSFPTQNLREDLS